jgi:hypothetical protein
MANQSVSDKFGKKMPNCGQTLSSEYHKAITIPRLLEVHSRLDIESVRRQQDYMQEILTSLKLEAIGARPTGKGKLKCHLAEQFSRKPRQRAVSQGFYDNYSDKPGWIAPTGSISRTPSGIVLERPKAPRDELAMLTRKPQMSEHNEERRKVLAAELRAISDT